MEYGVGLPPCLPHDFPKRGSWLRPSTYLHLCVIADRPTADLSTDGRVEGGIGRQKDGRTRAWVFRGGKAARGEKGAHFPNRESVNRTLMWMISRADQDRIAFEGRRVREGSLSRRRIGSKLPTTRRQTATLHDGCEFRTFFVPNVNATSKAVRRRRCERSKMT